MDSMKEQIIACQEAFERHPEDQEAFDRYSDILLENNELQAVIRLAMEHEKLARWEKIIAKATQLAQQEADKPRQSQLFMLCGNLCERCLKNNDYALKYYQQAAKSFPLNAKSFDASRRLLTLKGDHKQAVRLLQFEMQIMEEAVSRCRESGEDAKAFILHEAELCYEMSAYCRVLNLTEGANDFEKKARMINNDHVEAIKAGIDAKYQLNKNTASEAQASEDTNKAAENNEAEDVAENNEAEASAESNEAEDSAESNEAEDSAESNEGEDVAENNEAEDGAENNEGEDGAESNEAEDVAENNEGEDIAESNEAEAIAENNEAEDVAENNEAEAVAENNEAEDVAESNEAEDVAENNEGEDSAENNEGEDVAESNEAEDIAENNEGEDSAENNEGEDVAENNEGKDSAENNEGEDSAENNEAEDIAENNEAEDVAESNEGEDVAENNEAEDVAENNEAEDSAENNEGEDSAENNEGEEAPTATPEISLQSLEECCELIYRNVEDPNENEISRAATTGLNFVLNENDAREIASALEEAKAYHEMADLLKGISDKAQDDRQKKYASAWYADVTDRYLKDRETAVQTANPLASDADLLISYKAQSIMKGEDEAALRALAGSMSDTIRKLRKTPDEIPMMLDLAIIYEDRLNSMKDAEDQYKRIKSADNKNMAVLRFYNRFYRSTEDWVRLQNNLKIMKTAVQGSYRELAIVRELADISENKIGNATKAINEWNQLMKEGRFVAEAREALIGLYTRVQKWPALIDIYKNDMEALPADDKVNRIALLRKCIDIYDKELKQDQMVTKMYSQILDLDPSNEEAANELVKRYEENKSWNSLLHILDQIATMTTDKDKAIDTYYHIASIFSSNLGNVAKSIEPLTHIIELDPTQRKALHQLHEFYEQRNSWQNLYDILAKEAAVAEGAEKIELLKRQASIAERNLKSTEKAIESWEAVSASLEDPSEALEELARLYTHEHNSEALLSVYKRRLDVAHNVEERIDTLRQIATLYLDRLDRRDDAIATYREMLTIDEGRDDALSELTLLYASSKSWDDLVALYVELGNCTQIYELLDVKASDCESDEERMSLYARMATVAEDNLNDADMAIAALEKILAVDPKHETTARRLLAYYSDRGEHAKAISMHEILLSLTENDEDRLATYIEIARLYEEELAELENAATYLAKAILIASDRQDLREHFEALVEATQLYQLLYDVYVELLGRDNVDDSIKLALHRQVARVCQAHLSKDEEAIKSWEACLCANDQDVEAIDALSALYEAVGHWDSLLYVLDRKLSLTEDEEEEKALCFKRAELLLTQLDRRDEAESTYEHILELDNSNAEALSGLKSIYEVSENWDKMASILRRELDLMPEDALNVKYELAEVERTKLNHFDEAVGLYADILNEDANHVATISTLESLISEGVERHKLAAILEPVYKQSESHEKVCAMLEIRLETLDDMDKIPVWQEIYDIRHDALDDKALAFNAAVELFKLDPENETVWENLETLAADEAVESGYARLNDLYATIETDDEHNDAWRYAILRRRALIVEEKLEDETNCVPLWEKLHDYDADDMEPIDHLENLYKSSTAYEKLVKLYEFKAQHSDSSDEERIQYYLEAAQIYEDILTDSNNAIRVFQAVIEIDNTQEDALKALERLYIANGLWSELANLYDEELNLYTDSDQLHDIRCNLASVCTDHIADYERAIDCYTSVLTDNPAHEKALADADTLLHKLVSVECDNVADYRSSLCELLEPIYVQLDDKAKLVSLLRIKLADTEDAFDKVDLNRRIAELLLDSDVDDKDGAFEALQAALRIDISDEPLRTNFEDLALILGRPQAIIDLYNSAIENVDDDMLKHDLYKRMAHIYEDQLDDADKAIEAYRAMVEIDDMDVESLNALENLYTNASNWPELLSVLKLKADVGNGDERVDILRKMASINRDFLNNAEGAIENYSEILDNVSDDMDALNALEALYTQTENWEKLAENYEIKLNLTSDADEKHVLLNQMAQLQEEKLKAYDDAIMYHVQVLDLFPDDEETLDALDRLYLSQEQYEDLADILQKKLDHHQDDDLATSLEFRLGQINANELSNIDAALDYYRSILAREPKHEGAVDALNKLLEDETYRLDVSKILENVYATNEQYDKLVDILEIQCEIESDPEAQVELLKRIADIQQNQLSNYMGAFEAYARIVVLDQSEDNINQIEALSDVNNNPAALVDVYHKVVEAVYDADSQVAFTNRIADIQLNRLEDVAAAEQSYKDTLDIAADDATALNALDALYTKQENWDALLDILEKKLDADSSTETQIPVLLRMADIQETACKKPEDAISTFIRITEVDNTSSEAKQSLERLYAQQEMWQDLADLLLNEINETTDVDRQIDLKFRLAKLQHEKLDSDFEAIQNLNEIIEIQPENETVVAYLESLFEANIETSAIGDILEPLYRKNNQWEKLIHALEIRATNADDEFTQVQVLNDIAKTWEENLEKPAEALNTYGRIFKIQPADTDTQAQIARLASKTLAIETWADLYASVLEEDKLDDYSDKRIVMLTLAHLYAERLGKSEKAEELCNKMLEEEPEELDAYDVLEWIYAKDSNFEKLLDLWTRKNEIVQDTDEKLALCLRMATIQEEILHDDLAATKTYQSILEIEPTSAPAAMALERLLRKTNQFEDLAEFYRNQIDVVSSDDERVDMMQKLAMTLFNELHNTDDAVSTLRDALDIQPKSNACKRAVETMLKATPENEDTVETRHAMASMLEPIYTPAEWSKLASVLDVMINTTDDDFTRVELMMRQAALYEEHDTLHQRAFNTYAKAFVASPSTAEAREKVEALSTELNNAAELANVYMDAIEHCEDDTDKLHLYKRAATIWNDALHDTAKAAQCYEAICAQDDQNVDAIRALETIYAAEGKHEQLVDVYKRHAEISSSMIDQKDLFYKIADLQEGALNNSAAAIDTYLAVLDIDSEDQFALDALEKLYQNTENWKELINIYQQKIDNASDADERIQLHVLAAQTLHDKLNDVDAAIEHYNAALAESDEHVPSLEALENIYEASDRLDDLLDNLQTQADIYARKSDRAMKQAKLLKMSHILIDKTDDKARAVDILSTMLREDGANDEAVEMLNSLLDQDELVNDIALVLMPLYREQNNDEAFIRVSERKIATCDDDFEKRGLFLDAAKVAEQHDALADKAFDFLASALKAQPTDDEIISEIESLTVRQNAYSKLVDLCDKILEENSDPDVTVRLSLLAARYTEENLNNSEKTIALYERILEIDEFSEIALSALHRLYKATDNKDKLADILQKQIDAGQQPVNDLRYELALLRKDTEPTDAFELLKQVLLDEPANDAAISAIESLIHNKDLTNDVADILEPIYVDRNDNDKLIDLLNAKIDVCEDPSDAVMLYKRIATIDMDAKNDKAAAFDAWNKAIALDASDEEILSNIERLANDLGKWNELVEAYNKALEASQDDDAKLAIDLKLADVYVDKLGSDDDAIKTLKNAIERNDSNVDALHKLENIYARTNKSEELLSVKERLAELTFESSEQVSILFQCADIALNTLNNNEKGIEILEKIVAIDDTNLSAIDPLVTLYAEAGQNEKYVELLNKKLLATNDENAQFDIYMTLAKTYAEKLEDSAAAVENYKNALNIKASDVIYKALEDIFTKTNAFQDLDDLLIEQFDKVDSASEKAAILIKRAQLASENFGDNFQAGEYLKQAMEQDPSNTDAVNALDKLYTNDGRFDDLLELLKSQLDKASTVADKTAINIRIANLAATHLNDADTAIASLKNVLADDPANLDALSTLIKIYEQQKDYDLAMSALQNKLQIVASNEEKSDVCCQLAKLAETANWDIKQIAECYDQAISFDSKNTKALDARMDIAKSSKDVAKQLELLNIQAETIDDEKARLDVYNNIAKTAIDELNDYAIAANALAKVYEATPDDIELAEKLVNAYLKVNDADHAAPILNGIIDQLTAAKQNKKLTPFLCLKGRMLKQQGDVAGARAELEKAFALDKNNLDNNLELGIMRYDAGEYDDALKVMQVILLNINKRKEDKNFQVTAYYYLGLLRTKLNNAKVAKDMFNRALAIDPNHAPSKEGLAQLG